MNDSTLVHTSLATGVAVFFLLVVFAVPRALGAPNNSAPLKIEAPKDGKILIRVGGNAKQHGYLWVPENASLATVEDLFGADWASFRVSIRRASPAGEQQLKYRMDVMTRDEKAKIKIKHGDFIFFVWDRCWGCAPCGRPPLLSPEPVSTTPRQWRSKWEQSALWG